MLVKLQFDSALFYFDGNKKNIENICNLGFQSWEFFLETWVLRTSFFQEPEFTSKNWAFLFFSLNRKKGLNKNLFTIAIILISKKFQHVRIIEFRQWNKSVASRVLPVPPLVFNYKYRYFSIKKNYHLYIQQNFNNNFLFSIKFRLIMFLLPI